jgi:hypothetical protein
MTTQINSFGPQIGLYYVTVDTRIRYEKINFLRLSKIGENKNFEKRKLAGDKT